MLRLTPKSPSQLLEELYLAHYKCAVCFMRSSAKRPLLVIINMMCSCGRRGKKA